MRANKPTFILELPLVTGDQERRPLKRKFALARTLYNATLGQALGRLKRMREDARWRHARTLPKGRERNALFNSLQREYQLTENGLRTLANNHRGASGRTDFGAHEAQCIGRTVYRALERYMFKGAGKPRFKSFRQGINSIEGTDNHEIMFKPEQRAVVWRKHVYPVIIPETNYVREALADPHDASKPRRVKYCRVIRRTVHGKEAWYVQLALEGLAPVRHVYAPPSEPVGIDPGPSQIAVYSPMGAGLFRLAPGVGNQSREMRRLQRKLDRSRRANNPENYNADGTCKKGPKRWKDSNNYLKLKTELKEIYRRQAQTRKRDHGTLVNVILQMGGTVKIEKNSYLSYQKNFGKSTQRSGMGEFVQHLKRSAESANLCVQELDAYQLKLSQYDPATNTYTKKPLKQRWHRHGMTDTIVQRDIHSAFLACYATEKGHDPILLCKKWTTAEPLLRDAGLCLTYQPRNDQDWAQAQLRLTREVKPIGLTPTGKRCILNTVCAGQCCAVSKETTQSVPYWSL